MDARTARAYARGADAWIAGRSAHRRALRRLDRLVETLPPGARVADLGCGPGWYAARLTRRGHRAVALDLVRPMLAAARRHAPEAPPVRGDLACLPFGRGTLDGAIAYNAYQHLPADALPAALADLHHALRIGGRLDLTLGDLEPREASASARRRGVLETRWAEDDFPGRLFSFYSRERVRRLFAGAGFTNVRVDRDRRRRFWLWIRAERADTLPDYVRPGLDLLVCGLNPSLRSAETGIPYGRPGNRFWPAAVRAGLSARERDPWGALATGLGFTDLVKRPTRGAADLTTAEYRAGLERLDDCVRFFRPRAVCFVGLDGWRRAVDRTATAGWTASGFGGRPAYLMPSTSGLNAHGSAEDFVRHLKRARRGP